MNFPDIDPDKLPHDPVDCFLMIEKGFRGVMESRRSEDGISGVLLDEYLLALAAFEAIAKSVELEIPRYVFTGALDQDCNWVENLYSTLASRIRPMANRRQVLSMRSKVDSARSQFESALGIPGVCELNDGDIARIQQLINELRAEVAKSAGLGDSHRERLLARLEALQRELHKKLSNIANFWALASDAGIALGKLGHDAKPLVDRITEILRIIWAGQLHAEGLSSSVPLPDITRNRIGGEDHKSALDS